LLGKLLPVISDLDNSKRIIERIFNKFLSRFQSIYPSILNPEIINSTDYFSSQRLKDNDFDITEMIYMLRSIGVFINTLLGLNDNFMQYIDLLLSLILNPSSDKFLQIEALNIINKYYPRTYRGRMRIEHQFREKINELSKKHELDIYNTISKRQDFLRNSDDKNKEENNIVENENKEEENETSDINNKEQEIIIDKILFEKLNTFWSIWYPIVPDNVLLRIPIEQVKEGYIYYRMKYLLEKSNIKGYENIKIYQKNKNQMKKDDIIKILKLNINLPYPEKETIYLIKKKEIIKSRIEKYIYI